MKMLSHVFLKLCLLRAAFECFEMTFFAALSKLVWGVAAR